MLAGRCFRRGRANCIHRNESRAAGVTDHMERFGTLSFGHYGPLGGGRQLTARDSMHQAIDLAQGMDEIGADLELQLVVKERSNYNYTSY